MEEFKYEHEGLYEDCEESAQERQDHRGLLLPVGPGPFGLVPGNSFLMVKIKKTIALALSVCLLAFCPGCTRIFQPSVTDIARANISFLEGPVKVDISLDIVTDTIVAYYETEVLCHGENAYWDGNATVYYNGTFFTQECISQTDGKTRGKMWRGVWAEADTSTPVNQLLLWLSRIEVGACFYDDSPVTEVIDGKDISVYRINFTDIPLNWNHLIDVDFDSLFGGNELLNSFDNLNIELLVSTERLEIVEIRLSSCIQEGYCSGTINVHRFPKTPDTIWGDTLQQKAYLSEEWATQ